MKWSRCLLLCCLTALVAPVASAHFLGANGQYVTSVMLRRGDMPQTFWVKDFLPTASIQSFAVTASYNATNELGETVGRTLVPYESMETYNANGKVTGFYILLTEDDWRLVPPEKTALTFVCTVRGSYDADNRYNDMFSLGRAAGRDKYPEKITAGSSEEVPYWITPRPAARLADCDSSDRYFSGAFFLNAELKAEHRYMFGIAGADYPVELRLKGTAEDLLPTAKPYTNANEWADCGTNAWSFVPPAGGTYVFEVKSGAGRFGFRYAMLPDRLPAKHDHGEISTSYPATGVVPGYLVSPTNGFFDGVIDERLFRFSDYAADGCYVFRTEGADTNLLLRLYDSAGNVLAENRGTGDGGRDVQIAWCASDRRTVSSGSGCDCDCTCSVAVSGDVYVGVCQVLGDGEAPSAGPVTLSVTRVDPVGGTVPLTVVPDANGQSPYDAMANPLPSVPSEPGELGATVWSQTYVVQARAGTTYRAKARVEDGGSSNGLALTVRAYVMSGSTKRDLPAKSVVDAWRFDPSADGWMEFTADANCAVCLEVSAADGELDSGRGLPYGPYSVCVTAVADGRSDWGVLRVPMFGAADADMGWKVVAGPAAAGIRTGSEPYYPAGGSVIVPPGGPYVIAAKSIAGFQRPDPKGYASVYVTKDAVVDVPRYEYYDTFDPGDDDPKKAAKLSPSAGKPLTSTRSLWSGDSADWFSVTAGEGAFYRFSLPWESEGGDAEVRVYGPDQTETECAYNVYEDPASAVRIVAAKGKYYVRVAHASAGSPADTAYALETLMTLPGTIRLSKNVIGVRESAGYADVVVNRTGRDGRVRVRYRTEPIAAVPGEDYYSQEGELVWENGDNSSRTVSVKLIPRTVTEKKGEERSFKVVFRTAGWDEVDVENEYIPAFDSKMGDTAVVTVIEEGKVRPGCIRVADCRTPKAPAFEVTAPGVDAATNLVVRFERIDGTTGAAGVRVEAADGTAKNGTDYSFPGADLVWQDGERDVREVSVAILRSVDDIAAKSFKLKLTALRQYARPTLAASTVSVGIRNGRFAQTAAEFSKALPKTAGYTVGESRRGTWFVRPDGSWYGSGELTFKLTGPCLFRYAADGNPPVEVRVAAGEKASVVIPACDNLTYEYLFYDGLATELVQGVRTDEQVADASVDAVRVASGGKLPDGLKLVRDGSDGTWRVRGVPTKAGDFYARLQDGAKAEVGEVAYTVRPLRSAAGGFFGLARTADTRNNHPHLAQVTLTATDKGRLSAKAVIAGKSYAFAADGFSGWTAGEDGTRVLTADLVQLQKVVRGGQKVNASNLLHCVVVDAEPDAPEVWYGEGAALTLTMEALPDAQGSGYQEHVGYVGELVRDNSKVKAWQTEVSGYSAYYTAAFVPSGIPQVPTDADDGRPRGNGYVTLTVDAKGKVKYSGALPDGTTYSGSSVAALGTAGGVPAVRLPLFFSKGSGAFGGWVSVQFPDGRVPSGNISETDAELRPTVVPDEADGVRWSTDDSTLTFKGQLGFELDYDAVGGWYDTVVNLQRYYLDRSVDRFSVDMANGGDLWQLKELLPSGYDFVADATADGQPVDLSVNGLLVDRRTLVKDSTKSYYDWPRCVCPANVKLNFKRATGVFSGTCDLWYEGVDEKGALVQKSCSGCRHAGVLLMTCGECASLSGEVVAPGAVVVPQTIRLSSGYRYTWKSSHRFNIRATEIPR